VQTWYPRANVDASYILGICYIQTKDYPNARQAFAKMFDVQPNSAASYLFTARMLFRQAFDPVAERIRAEAVTTSMPNFVSPTFCSASFISISREYPKPLRNSRKNLPSIPAISRNAPRITSWPMPIPAFRSSKTPRGFSSAPSGSMLLPRALHPDGKVLEKKGEFQLAVRALQKAATMDPNNAMTHTFSARLYRDMGKKEEAETELKLAEQLQTQPDSRP